MKDFIQNNPKTILATLIIIGAFTLIYLIQLFFFILLLMFQNPFITICTISALVVTGSILTSSSK